MSVVGILTTQFPNVTTMKVQQEYESYAKRNPGGGVRVSFAESRPTYAIPAAIGTVIDDSDTGFSHVPESLLAAQVPEGAELRTTKSGGDWSVPEGI